MQELEKILEEIKGLIEKHKNKAYELVAREPLTQCYTEADIEQIKVHELAVVRDIIRKHMNDKSETYALTLQTLNRLIVRADVIMYI